MIGRIALVLAVTIAWITAACGTGTPSARMRLRPQRTAVPTPETGWSFGNATFEPPATSAATRTVRILVPRTPAPRAEPGAVPAPALPAERPPSVVTVAEPDAGAPRPRTGRYGYFDKGSSSKGQYEHQGPIDVSLSGREAMYVRERGSSKAEIQFRFGAEGIYIVRATVITRYGTFEERFEPPQLAIKWPLQVGGQWSGTYKSQQLHVTVNYRASVVRDEVVSIRAGSFRTFVIESASEASGTFAGSERSTVWYAPEIGMLVKRITDAQGSYGGMHGSGHHEHELTNVPGGYGGL